MSEVRRGLCRECVSGKFAGGHRKKVREELPPEQVKAQRLATLGTPLGGVPAYDPPKFPEVEKWSA